MNATAESPVVTMEHVRHELRNLAMVLQSYRVRVEIIQSQGDFIHDAAEHGFIDPSGALAKIQQIRKEHGL